MSAVSGRPVVMSPSACRRRSGRRRQSSSSCGLAKPLTSRGCGLPSAFGPLLDLSCSWLVLVNG